MKHKRKKACRSSISMNDLRSIVREDGVEVDLKFDGLFDPYCVVCVCSDCRGCVHEARKLYAEIN